MLNSQIILNCQDIENKDDNKKLTKKERKKKYFVSSHLKHKPLTIVPCTSYIDSAQYFIPLHNPQIPLANHEDFKMMRLKLKNWDVTNYPYECHQYVYEIEGRKPVKRQTDHPFVIREMGKCIKCGRCVRLTQGLDIGLGFVQRGIDTEVMMPFDHSLECIPGDMIKQIIVCCPTGALGFLKKPTTDENGELI